MMIRRLISVILTTILVLTYFSFDLSPLKGSTESGTPTTIVSTTHSVCAPVHTPTNGHYPPAFVTPGCGRVGTKFHVQELYGDNVFIFHSIDGKPDGAQCVAQCDVVVHRGGGAIVFQWQQSSDKAALTPVRCVAADGGEWIYWSQQCPSSGSHDDRPLSKDVGVLPSPSVAWLARSNESAWRPLSKVQFLLQQDDTHRAPQTIGVSVTYPSRSSGPHMQQPTTFGVAITYAQGIAQQVTSCTLITGSTTQWACPWPKQPLGVGAITLRATVTTHYRSASHTYYNGTSAARQTWSGAVSTLGKGLVVPPLSCAQWGCGFTHLITPAVIAAMQATGAKYVRLDFAPAAFCADDRAIAVKDTTAEPQSLDTCLASDNATLFYGTYKGHAGLYDAYADQLHNAGFTIIGVLGNQFMTNIQCHRIDSLPYPRNVKKGMPSHAPCDTRSWNEANVESGQTRKATGDNWNANAFALRAGALAKHFEGLVNYWEIWNEPNNIGAHQMGGCGSFDRHVDGTKFPIGKNYQCDGNYFIYPSNYAALLTKTAVQIHANNRDAIIITAGLLTTGCGSKLVDTWTRRTGVAYWQSVQEFGQEFWGWKAHLPYDAVGYHLYVCQEQTNVPIITATIRAYVQSILRATSTKHLYITEVGWTTDLDPTTHKPQTTDKGQAQNLTTAFTALAAMPKVRMAAWYALLHDGGWILMDGANQRPAYGALQRFPVH